MSIENLQFLDEPEESTIPVNKPGDEPGRTRFIKQEDLTNADLLKFLKHEKTLHTGMADFYQAEEFKEKRVMRAAAGFAILLAFSMLFYIFISDYAVIMVFIAMIGVAMALILGQIYASHKDREFTELAASTERLVALEDEAFDRELVKERHFREYFKIDEKGEVVKEEKPKALEGPKPENRPPEEKNPPQQAPQASQSEESPAIDQESAAKQG